MKPRLFGKIYLEITNVCNLACDFCPPTLRSHQFLSLKDFEFLLDRLSGWGKDLYFHVKGEPLLHPKLPEFLALAGQRGFRVTLTTNGTLLGELAEVFWQTDAVRQINVSMHSQAAVLDPQGYGKQLQVFLDRHRNNPTFPVSLRIWDRQGELQRYPSQSLGPNVFLNQDNQFAWPSLNLPQRDTRGFCHGLSNQLAVLVDGTVVPCCLDGEGVMNLGNLFTTPLQDILASPRATAICDGFRQRHLVEPLCRTCGFRQSRIV